MFSLLHNLCCVGELNNYHHHIHTNSSLVNSWHSHMLYHHMFYIIVKIHFQWYFWLYMTSTVSVHRKNLPKQKKQTIIHYNFKILPIITSVVSQDPYIWEFLTPKLLENKHFTPLSLTAPLIMIGGGGTGTHFWTPLISTFMGTLIVPAFFRQCLSASSASVRHWRCQTWRWTGNPHLRSSGPWNYTTEVLTLWALEF